MYLYSDLKKNKIIEDSRKKIRETNTNHRHTSMFNELNMDKNIDTLRETLSKKNNFLDFYNKKEKQIKEHIRAYNIKIIEKRENENKINSQNNVTKILNDIRDNSYEKEKETKLNSTFLTASKNFNNSSIRKSYLNTEEKIEKCFENDYDK